MATANLNEPTSASDGNIPYIGASENDGTGNTLREAINRLNARVKEIYGSQNGSNVVQTPFVDGDNIKDDGVTHAKLENRYTALASITTLANTVSFDCSTASVFELSGDLTGAYTIDLTGYKKGQVISIFPLKGQTVTLDAQGTSTNTFNKLAAADYDNTVTSLLQIECVDDSATDPVFFYSVATYASDSSI